MPPVEPDLPKTPFEKICGDYFQLGANNYLVVVDHLSGWPEVVQVKSGHLVRRASVMPYRGYSLHLEYQKR